VLEALMTNSSIDKKGPVHVGLIPDGNRRWARQNNIDLVTAYWYTMQQIAMCLELFFDRGALSVSVYLLSKNNVLRARDDLNAVIENELRLVKEILPLLIEKYGLGVYHAGNVQILPQDFRSAISNICRPNNGKDDPFPRLYLCIGYDPFEEIANLIGKKSIDSGNLLDHLSVPVELDAIIRTGGEIRISGFLPLQCKYAEFFFESYLFPDISKHRVEDVLNSFELRARRFGR
jgi:undecaprenyl diphosphate synthase